MTFQMSDIPLANPKVADAIARCLQKCDRAFNDVLVETKEFVSDSEWKLLRRGIGQIMGSEMYEMWCALIEQHPKFKSAAFGEDAGGPK
jgi:hypothetical protein